MLNTNWAASPRTPAFNLLRLLEEELTEAQDAEVASAATGEAAAGPAGPSGPVTGGLAPWANDPSLSREDTPLGTGRPSQGNTTASPSPGGNPPRPGFAEGPPEPKLRPRLSDSDAPRSLVARLAPVRPARKPDVASLAPRPPIHSPSLPQRSATEWVRAGIGLLHKEKRFEASLAFQEAYRMDAEDPLIMSYLGLTMALDRSRGKDGIALCEEAVRRDGFRVELFHNLGRVYLLSGRKRKAHLAFLRGKALDRTNRAILEELDVMGIRKEPVFPFLRRNHPANRVAGLALTRLGFRR